MNQYTILLLLTVALALGGVGCDDGRAHGSRRQRNSNPANAAKSTLSEPRNTPSEPKPVAPPAQAERYAEEAESTAADLGQAITTLGEVCGAAQETRRALLTRDYDTGNKADSPAKEVGDHGDK